MLKFRYRLLRRSLVNNARREDSVPTGALIPIQLWHTLRTRYKHPFEKMLATMAKRSVVLQTIQTLLLAVLALDESCPTTYSNLSHVSVQSERKDGPFTSSTADTTVLPHLKQGTPHASYGACKISVLDLHHRPPNQPPSESASRIPIVNAVS